MASIDNETWLIDIGDAIITARAEEIDTPHSPLERLTYCLWAADYAMRNAGDLTAATDVDKDFHLDGRRLSTELGLPRTAQLFMLDSAEFERVYFDAFNGVCNELRQAHS